MFARRGIGPFGELLNRGDPGQARRHVDQKGGLVIFKRADHSYSVSIGTQLRKIGAPPETFKFQERQSPSAIFGQARKRPLTRSFRRVATASWSQRVPAAHDSPGRSVLASDRYKSP